MNGNFNDLFKNLLKKKMYIKLIPAIAPIVLVIVVLIIIFVIGMGPVLRFSQVATTVGSWFEKAQNTITLKCFMCTDEELEEREEYKKEEKFIKKVMKIKDQYKQGKGMLEIDPKNDSSTTTREPSDCDYCYEVTRAGASIDLNISLLISAALYEEDIQGFNSTTLDDLVDKTDEFVDNNTDQPINDLLDGFLNGKIKGFLSLLKQWIHGSNDLNRNLDEEERADRGLWAYSDTDDVATREAKEAHNEKQMDLTDEGFFEFGRVKWYEAKGDPIGIEDWYQEEAKPGNECYAQTVKFATNDDPSGASLLRRLAKHMVKRKINARCDLIADHDKDGNLIGYHWQKSVTFDYVLDIDDDDRLYTLEMDQDPYPEYMCYEKCNADQEEQGYQVYQDGQPSTFVKYLLSTYIPENYSEYLPNKDEVEPSRYLGARKGIKNWIYSYSTTYEQWVKGWEDKLNGGGNFGSGGYVYAECNAVVVDGAGTYSLEDYVARVVTAENGSAGPESMKAQAIASRTYVLSRTNNCKQSIANSQTAQVMTTGQPSAAAVAATQATAGMVLLYNGNIFSSEYDSFYKGGDFSCNSTTCSVTYQKKPALEKHVVTVPASLKNSFAGGHGRGMSQIAANYMSDQGSSYQEILKFFYSDGVTIGNLTGGLLAGQKYTSNVKIHENVNSLRNSGNYPVISGFAQCVWYARYRAIEIVKNSNMPEVSKQYIVNYLLNDARGHGRDWYKIFNDSFEKTTDITKARPGAIISWSGGNGHSYGHVAIVESVNSDGTITVSEAWKKGGPDGGTQSWNDVGYQVRKYTIEQIRNYGGGKYRFNGYVYLLG